MFATVSVILANPTLARLLEYQQRSGGDLSNAIEEAVEYWLSRQAEPDENASARDGAVDAAGDRSPLMGNPGNQAHAPVKGYQWKLLFLPEGTWLRTWSYGEHRFARVVGNRILHEGKVVSPNQFARSFARSMRNAWKDISICLPGEKIFRLANKLRRELEQREAGTQTAPHCSQHNATQNNQRPHHSGQHKGEQHKLDQQKRKQHKREQRNSGKLPDSRQQTIAPGKAKVDPTWNMDSQWETLETANTGHRADKRVAKQTDKQAKKHAAKQHALQAALEAALSAALAAHHASQASSARNVTPGARWDLPERRSMRYRLEDVAFE
jgi:hypothetical protein